MKVKLMIDIIDIELTLYQVSVLSFDDDSRYEKTTARQISP